MSTSSVFICNDPGLNDLLDVIAGDLAALGVKVLRGPLVPLGGPPCVVQPFDGVQEVGVMMFSSRCIADRALMQAAVRLRGIVNPAIGLETVDLVAADEMGIIVGHGATADNYMGMAEATVMLMLALRYQLRASERVLAGELARPPRSHAWSRMLRGCTVGLVGYGRIARHTASLLQPFGSQVLAYKPGAVTDASADPVRFTDLDTLLRESDIVSLHATLTPHNRGLVGERELGLMKPGAYLVNTARGALVDEDALYRALQSGRIAGAALDTFCVEPLPQDSPLRSLDNVILTPHMVGQTQENFESLRQAAVVNITRILAGELPLFCKNPHIEPRWRERLPGLGSGG